MWIILLLITRQLVTNIWSCQALIVGVWQELFYIKSFQKVLRFVLESLAWSLMIGNFDLWNFWMLLKCFEKLIFSYSVKNGGIFKSLHSKKKLQPNPIKMPGKTLNVARIKSFSLCFKLCILVAICFK